MRAVMYEQYAVLPKIENAPDPIPPEHDFVLRLKGYRAVSKGLAWMGPDPEITLPHVPGREIAGVIEAVGKNVGVCSDPTFRLVDFMHFAVSLNFGKF